MTINIFLKLLNFLLQIIYSAFHLSRPQNYFELASRSEENAFGLPVLTVVYLCKNRYKNTIAIPKKREVQN